MDADKYVEKLLDECKYLQEADDEIHGLLSRWLKVAYVAGELNGVVRMREAI